MVDSIKGEMVFMVMRRSADVIADKLALDLDELNGVSAWPADVRSPNCR